MYCIHLTTLTVAYERNLMRLYRTTIALDRANLVKILFFIYAIISATVYDPNLNLSVSRTFCHFCSCANCELAFEIIFSREFHSNIKNIVFFNDLSSLPLFINLARRCMTYYINATKVNVRVYWSLV